jgi:hypothetical protein
MMSQCNAASPLNLARLRCSFPAIALEKHEQVNRKDEALLTPNATRANSPTDAAYS